MRALFRGNTESLLVKNLLEAVLLTNGHKFQFLLMLFYVFFLNTLTNFFELEFLISLHGLGLAFLLRKQRKSYIN